MPVQQVTGDALVTGTSTANVKQANKIEAGLGRTITSSVGPTSDFAIHQNVNMAGVCTDVPFANYLTTSVDSMDASGTPNPVGGNTFIRANFGVGAKGCRYALQAWAVQMAPTANTSDTLAQYVGGQFSFYGNTNEGGTAPTPGNSRGFGFGFNAYVNLTPGATNWSGLFGGEIDVLAEAGSSHRNATGLLIVLKGGHASHGTDNVDAGIVIAAADTATTRFDYGLQIGWGGHQVPVMSTGTLITAPGIGTVANGVDFSSVNFSGAAFRSPGFLVDGVGNIKSWGLLSRNFPSDVAAKTGGVPVGGLYHNQGAVRVRLS
jgi:hypothetical protein